MEQAETGTERRVHVLRQHLTPNKTAALNKGGSTQIPRKLFHPPQAQCLAEYDYVIVGAGSAGCALAARLAEKQPLKTILLIDAGGDNRQFRVRSPFVTCPRLQNSDLDFAYRTTPQPLQQNRKSHWPRGKMLGGCSSINFMLAVRGDPRGFDKWASDFGCIGWSYAEVEKYFIRLEDYRGKQNSLGRGRHGPMTITDNRDEDHIRTKGTVDAFVGGCAEIGLPEVPDYNTVGGGRSAHSQTTIRDGDRWDTANAYLFGPDGAFAQCPNLSCLTHEQVARVTFDQSQETPRATGVELISGPAIRARHEVILCAGAVGSAQILLLSGVGPKKHLDEKNVKCVVDLPGVGQGLKDHLMVAHAFELNDCCASGFIADSKLMIAAELAKMALTRKGLFTTSWVQGMAFADSSIQQAASPNDIQIHFVPLLSESDEELAKANFGFDRETQEAATKRDYVPIGITFLPSLLQPRSTGFIELASNDPKDHPIIEPRYLSHPDDIQILLEAWKLCDKIAASNNMKPIIKGPLVDDSVKFDPDSDEYRVYKIKRDVITIYHPTSTCKMGPDSDPMSVLDPRTLSVRKVTNLRVADCASFPDITAGNTNLPAIMIGERCADLIAFGQIA